MNDRWKSDVQLRDVSEEDLPIFFEQQLDPSANDKAAFTVKDPSDWEVFSTHWRQILSDEAITKKTILLEGIVVGHISNFKQFDQQAVSYWIGKQYWNRGIATQALFKFLNHVKTRPLYARAAKDNLASLRVLEKCGFSIIDEDKGFSNARGVEVEEYILKLGAAT
ncbi:RimJ/RimL family protein N-acetyltransferase [Melghirimyces profundicolus]|uniref:RimJ/RimL family protein N-acetyltransferase n=2 Tax=Melghirimyces profundicolus TaxID=1242148 RepID=A0A2T6BZ27_9BACL|nr:RimJ/RimL family protein N-acetyltransferase [Melghirimyces profundicolus]